MTTKIVTTLRCNECGKEESFIGNLHGPQLAPPLGWYRFGLNDNSLWSSIDFMVSGDFCSLECAVAYIQKAIEKRDNPITRVYGRIVLEKDDQFLVR